MLYDRKAEEDRLRETTYGRTDVETWLAQARDFVDTIARLLPFEETP